MADFTVKTLWFWRKGEDGPELLTAWDEWQVDGNYEGWREDCEQKFAQVKSEDAGGGPRQINFTFDFGKIEQAFWPVDVEVEVSNQERVPDASNPGGDE